GATMYMVMLAGFKAILSRYSGSEDISVGTPIANRSQEEVEGLIGFFANTLVMRSRVRGGGFDELLREVKRGALGGYAHQDMPFEKLVEELQPERDLSRNPLFQIGFTMQSGGGAKLELEGIKTRRMESGGVGVKTDLEMHVTDGGGKIRAGIGY